MGGSNDPTIRYLKLMRSLGDDALAHALVCVCKFIYAYT